MDEERVQATIGTGPVGTGFFLLDGAERTGRVEAWWCVAFLPLVPIERLAAGAERSPASPTELTIRGRDRVPLVDALRRYARAAGAVVFACSLLVFAVWTIGVPWATAPLRGLQDGALQTLDRHPGWSERLSPVLGGRLGAFVDVAVGAVGMGVETGVFLAGAAIPILVFMHMDERIRRVPLRALRGRSRARSSGPVRDPGSAMAGAQASRHSPDSGFRQ